MIRAYILRYIARNMSHNDIPTRNAIFKAINDGMADAHYEDNVYTRLNFTVLQLVNNGEEFHPQRFLGQTVTVSSKMLAGAASSAVLESCAADKQPLWVTQSIFDIHENESGDALKQNADAALTSVVYNNEPKKQYAVLEGIEAGNRFFCINHDTVLQLADGSIGYRLLTEVDTVEEAQTFLYGRTFTSRAC